MEEIFHEKQEGSLCAQHCLNALLQAHYFTAVELAALASQMDDEERSRMAEGGVHSEDYHKFLQQPSTNVDDSGYFSIQVIASALKVWGLEIIPYSSQNPLAQAARQDPTMMSAYICNYRDHWLTIRKIGRQWFNLNSLLSGPELISDTFLSLFLAQLQEEGYSIFIVDGKLPECAADRILFLQPAVQVQKPRLLTDLVRVSNNTNQEDDDEDDDKALTDTINRTLAESIQMENDSLEVALSMSLKEYEKASGNTGLPGTSSKCDHPIETKSSSTSDREMSEQEMLEVAIKMSMET